METLRKYTVKQGRRAAHPFLNPMFSLDFGKPARAAWHLQLSEGWDYILPRNQSQWVKLCGESFCIYPRNRNAVMLAGRYTPQGGIEISPYFNRKGAAFFFEKVKDKTWPVVKVQTLQDIYFGYTEWQGYIKTTIITGGRTAVLNFDMKARWIQSEINFYFGGSEAATQEVSIYKRKLTQIEFDETGRLVRPQN